MFNTVLIANRGEIAVRAIRTLKRLGVKSIAVYSDADRNAQHVRDADVAIALGGDKPSDSYLRIDKILAAARETGAQAIYPGYGFLSESAEFADACEAAGIAFVGPTGEQIREFGLKHRARELAGAAGVPMAPGTGLLANIDEALQAAERIGYPVMLKTTAGGGGIGLTRCEDAAALSAAWNGFSPRWRWRSTFSTMTIASSTTRPTESTIASSVRRLIVKPKASIRNTAPISEIGIATTGISTERAEPRKRKMTMTTIRSVSERVLTTSRMASPMYSVAS